MAGTKKGAAKRTPKPKQQKIPGAEGPDEIPEVTQAAESYAEIRDERCELSKQEADAQAALAEVMKKHGLTIYKTLAGAVVKLSTTSKATVTLPKAKKGDTSDRDPD